VKAIVTPVHDQLRKRLLLEGAESYLEAYTALLEYEREVQKKCRRVMQTYLGDYSTAARSVGSKPRVYTVGSAKGFPQEDLRETYFEVSSD
jgi:hypothetical protein